MGRATTSFWNLLLQGSELIERLEQPNPCNTIKITLVVEICKQRFCRSQNPCIVIIMFKKILILAGTIMVAVSGISCNSTNAKVGLPIPFTDPAVRVNLETQVQPLPPKICIGLDVVEN